MRRLGVFWLIGLAVPIFAGCGQGLSRPVSPASAQPTVAVAAAADLKYALDEVIDAFRKQHPQIDVKATFGSSGNIFAQLSNKAPFDIYFSADIDYPRRLVEQGHALNESEFRYAAGQIVVWVRNESALDLENRGIMALLDPGVRKIAIANPKHAPYGRAAEASLRHFELLENVADRLVLGENIAQTAQFVESGAADVGIIALSLATAPALVDQGRYWIIPPGSYPALEQGGVILTWAKDRKATEQLRSFVIAEPGRAIFKRYGFLLPGE
ncbi:MAG: molybdate ABC transporter substrate-binding protein [Planctomycetaceae bacterium]